LQFCQDNPGRPWEAGARKIFGDDQEKPTSSSRISDWPLSTKETLHTISLVDIPRCRMCEQEDETVGHVLCECPELSSIRECVFGEVWPTPADIKKMSPGGLPSWKGQDGR